MTIFLADDDADDRYFFKEALSETKKDCELVNFTNGLELYNYISNNPHLLNPALFFIVLDLRMPVQDGIETLKIIRKNPAFRQIPVFIWSGRIKEIENSAITSLGIAGSYLKSVEFQKMVSVINDMFRISSGHPA